MVIDKDQEYKKYPTDAFPVDHAALDGRRSSWIVRIDYFTSLVKTSDEF